MLKNRHCAQNSKAKLIRLWFYHFSLKQFFTIFPRFSSTIPWDLLILCFLANSPLLAFVTWASLGEEALCWTSPTSYMRVYPEDLLAALSSFPLANSILAFTIFSTNDYLIDWKLAKSTYMPFLSQTLHLPPKLFRIKFGYRDRKLKIIVD